VRDYLLGFIVSGRGVLWRLLPLSLKNGIKIPPPHPKIISTLFTRSNERMPL